MNAVELLKMFMVDRKSKCGSGVSQVFLTTRKAAWYIISAAYACPSVCQTITFERFNAGKFIFTHPVYFEGIWVMFVYEGHRVKVKVTEAKQVDNPYSRNVKLRSAITPVLQNTQSHETCV